MLRTLWYGVLASPTTSVTVARIRGSSSGSAVYCCCTRLSAGSAAGGGEQARPAGGARSAITV